MNMNKRNQYISLLSLLVFFSFILILLYQENIIFHQSFLLWTFWFFLCLYIYFLLVSGLSCFSNCNKAPRQESLSPTRYSQASRSNPIDFFNITAQLCSNTIFQFYQKLCMAFLPVEGALEHNCSNGTSSKNSTSQ